MSLFSKCQDSAVNSIGAVVDDRTLSEGGDGSIPSGLVTAATTPADVRVGGLVGHP